MTHHRLLLVSLVVSLAPTFACSAEVAEGEAGESTEEALVSAGAGALPKARDLVPIELRASGLPIFASNNPEIVEGDGVLATLRDLAGATGTRLTSNYAWGPAPAPRLVGATVLDAACARGGVKDIGVYIAHIARSGYVALGVVAATDDIDVDTFGDLEEGPWNQLRSASFVSAAATKKYVFTPEASRSYVRTKVRAGQYVQLAAAPGRGGYLDGRLRIRGTGCFFPYVVSQREARATALPTRYATGNVAWKNWYCVKGQCSGEGRLAGLYGGETLTGESSVDLRTVGDTKGIILGRASQSMRAKVHMGDSGEVAFGNYGATQAISVRVRNAGTSCLKVRSELVSYVAVPADAQPTYGVYNALSDVPQIYWNGPIGKSTDKQRGALDHAILFVDKDRNRPTAIPSTLRKGLHEITLQANASEGTFYRIPVPGMITVPVALTFSAEACR